MYGLVTTFINFASSLEHPTVEVVVFLSDIGEQWNFVTTGFHVDFNLVHIDYIYRISTRCDLNPLPYVLICPSFFIGFGFPVFPWYNSTPLLVELDWV